MNTKNRLLITVLPIFIIGIIGINLAFGLFFRNFIFQSERDLIHTSANLIDDYFDGKSSYYANTVNDWAHWDDTYYFIENSNMEYIDLNLTDSALNAIDVSFMIFLNSENLIVHKLYIDSDEAIITKFSSDFSQNYDDVINFSRIADDISGIINIGVNYYFVASSRITDSLMKENVNGTLILGKQINREIISHLEKLTEYSLNEIKTFNDINRPNEIETSNILRVNYEDTVKNSINVELTIPNKYDLNSSIVLSMNMPRNLYVSGMKQVIIFSYLNTIGSLLLSFFIFLILGKYITKPFNSLINDVKSVNFKSSEIQFVPESGKDEFSFLRKSINDLMNKVLKSQAELHTTLVSIGEGIITVDLGSKIQFMNPVAQEMMGWRFEESLNMQLDEVLIVIDADGGKTDSNFVKEVYEKGKTIKTESRILLNTNNGNVLDVKITAAPIKDNYGSLTGCVFVVNDITESKKRQKYIEYLSYRDILTGLYNRRFYEEKIKEFEVKENFVISIILIDVNGLKLTNDAFGHGVGDRLLIKVAECIEKSIRTEDLVCRIGGDEFVILLPNSEAKEVISIITRVQESIEKGEISNLPISVSSGWATKQQNSELIESTFKRAEDMMYHNKAVESKSHRHQTIQIILNTLYEKNPREEAHSKRVSDLCLKIGEYLELDLYQIKNLQTAGLLHDIGKIGIGNNYLDKNGPLNEEEWFEVKQHPQISYNILSSINDYGPLANIVLSHHERWDGKGYPNGLIGEKIPLESRIIALADAYDAMISDRPYRSGMKEEEILLIIKNEMGKQFDPEIVKAFFEMIEGQK